MIYWRMTQAIAILPPLILILVIIASLSYGKRSDVYNSWYGGDFTIIGSTYSIMRPTNWVSDYKYLMWKDQKALSVPQENYTLMASLA